MIYNEEYIGTATTVSELIYILSTEVPKETTLEIVSYDHNADVEVWYDKGANIVILK